VIAYRLAPLSGVVARRLIKVPYTSLPNLLLDREMQPERLLSDCTAETLATALDPLLSDPAARTAQIARGREVVATVPVAPSVAVTARAVAPSFHTWSVQEIVAFPLAEMATVWFSADPGERRFPLGVQVSSTDTVAAPFPPAGSETLVP
jgi:hypothetical protein